MDLARRTARFRFRPLAGVVALSAILLLSLPVLARDAGEARPLWQEGFQNGAPAGSIMAGGTFQREPEGVPVGGDGCLRCSIQRTDDLSTLVLFPLPGELTVPRLGRLSLWLKTPEANQTVRLRWFALGSDMQVLFERPFQTARSSQWSQVEWDMYRWRWGAQDVGDWTDVRAIALSVDSAVESVWLDEVELHGEPNAPSDANGRQHAPIGDAVLRTAEQWLRTLAFEKRPTRSLAGEDFVVMTDAVDEVSQAELEEVLRQLRRTRRWVGQTFEPALRPVQDRSPGKLLIFRDRKQYTAFFRALGKQWGCTVAPPATGGYTVQDISACCLEPDGRLDQAVVAHESVHCVLARELRLPTGTVEHAWVQEGLANYVQLCLYPESMDLEALSRNFDKPIGRGTLFRPLDQICGQRVSRKNYAQLASLCAYLLGEHPDWMNVIAARLAQHDDLHVILAELGTDLKHLETLWLAWGRKTYPPGMPSDAHFPAPPELAAE